LRHWKYTAVKAQAKEAGIEVIEEPGSETLKATAAAYIDNALKRGANEAAAQARLVSDSRLGKRSGLGRPSSWARAAASRIRTCCDRSSALCIMPASIVAGATHA
jgi:type IV secretory pathway TrbL component